MSAENPFPWLKTILGPSGRPCRLSQMPVPSDRRISRTARGSGICQCMAGYLFPPGSLARWIVPNPVLRARWVRQTNLDFSKEPIICSPSGTGFVNEAGRGKGKMTVRPATGAPAVGGSPAGGRRPATTCTPSRGPPFAGTVVKRCRRRGRPRQLTNNKAENSECRGS